MAAQTQTIPAWGGTALTVASFLAYSKGVLERLAAIGFDKLSLQTLGPQLAERVNRLADFVKRNAASEETPEIVKLDANRDALWKSFSAALAHLEALSTDHPLHAHVLELKPELQSYKGIDRHELSRETSEIFGLQRDMETTKNITALKELGLYKILGHLFEANTAIAAKIKQREDSRAEKIAAKGGETASSVRKEVLALLLEVFAQVNALDRVASTDDTKKAVKEVVGVIDHYKQIAAQPAHKKSGGGDDPAPEPEPASDPSQG